MKLCYLNGRFIPLEQACLPVTDLIIQRGIGVFDTINTHGRKPVKLSAHLRRLHESASKCGIEPPLSIDEESALIKKGILLFDENSEEVVIRAYITGGDHHDNFTGRFTAPRFFLIFHGAVKPSEDLYCKGIRLRSVDSARFMPSSKTINYMIPFTAANSDPEAFEILYCPEGRITEAAHSSFFMVKDKTLVTAPLDKVLQGTTRDIVLDIASQENIPVDHRCPSLEEIQTAEEAFITGSIKEILPVTWIDNIRIGNGLPGKMTLDLHRLYLENIHRWQE